jgi:hypothetical protein
MDPEVLHWNGVDYVPKSHCDGLRNEIRKQSETIAKMLGYHVDDERRIAALEAGVKQWASECSDCDGRGFFMVPVVSKLGGNIKHDCHSCAYIRKLLDPSGPKTKGDAA